MRYRHSKQSKKEELLKYKNKQYLKEPTMISKKTGNVLSMFLMVLIMTFVVVFVSTAVNFGFSSDFIMRWMKGWGVAFIIAFPTVLIIMPFIRKLVAKITD
jgi:UDP-N-acetylmuramyl pentapeptide phosphotransferase/UDP-N-acetylglucosamine-1-phosphate transferase